LIRALTFGRYADDNFGGLERYVFELARGLEPEVHYTNVVARRGSAPDLKLVGERRVRPCSVGGTPVCPTRRFGTPSAQQNHSKSCISSFHGSHGPLGDDVHARPVKRVISDIAT
jgi:hypothetical protein